MKRPRRPNITPEEKAAALAAVLDIYADEQALSGRGYTYRLWMRGERGEILLHGQRVTKGSNEETIQRLLLEFRQQGLLDWDAVLDPSRRTIYGYTAWDSPREALQWLADDYRRDLWADQPHRVELLSEKEALTSIVEPVTRDYQVPLTPCKGFNSWGKFWEVAKRIVTIGRPTWVLILTDHDRAGYNMAESGERIMDELLDIAADQLDLPRPVVKYDRIGLNAQQVARYEIEPRDPKPSEHPGMVNFVAECAEVDFLRSEQIREIVRDGIEAHITDRDAYRATLTREAAERAVLSELADQA